MNKIQELWWEQAESDHSVFLILRSRGVAQCHTLHYLQMATEKIAKAYFWKSESAPPRSHQCFVQFLRRIGQVQQDERARIANLFTFGRYTDFQNWIRAVLPIAYELERLAPALAGNGPNPEYPWPHDKPHASPVNHHFDTWKMLKTGRGRDFMRMVQIAVTRFPEYSNS